MQDFDIIDDPVVFMLSLVGVRRDRIQPVLLVPMSEKEMRNSCTGICIDIMMSCVQIGWSSMSNNIIEHYEKLFDAVRQKKVGSHYLENSRDET